MLEIKNLTVEVENKTILKNINLNVGKNEVHFITGPNGAGKTSLSFAILGKDDYKIKEGEIRFDGKNINNLKSFERAKLGIFLAFQQPIEIEGLKIYQLIWSSLKALDREITPNAFNKKLDQACSILEINKDFLQRETNLNFSGGEKKKSELLQMLVFNPKLLILDEVDSGIDLVNIKKIILAIQELRKNGTSLIIISHNLQILDYVKPDRVHILFDGTIKASGSMELVEKIKENGFNFE